MEILRLANEDQTTVIDLIGGPVYLRSGYDFATAGQGGVFTYEPYGAQFDFGNFQPHTETFDIAIRGRWGLVRPTLTKLQDFLESVRLFHDGDLAAKSCWLEWSSTALENPKRSLLYSGGFKVISQDNITPGLQDCTILGTLSLVRHPLWENIALEPTIDTNVVSTLGGKYDYTGIAGNTLARLWQTRVFATGEEGSLYRVWIGLRRFNQGVANFNPVWECEDGANVAADTADGVDATASDGNKVTTTFATGGLVERFRIEVAQVAAANGHTDYEHFQGRYLVLARCKVVGANGVAGVQMHYGYTANQMAEEVYISNVAWGLIPLGNISIPPWEGNRYNDPAFMAEYTINIYAEEIVTCDLDMDCFVLIPNEHLLTFEGYMLAETIHARLDVLEDDREVAYVYSGVAFVIADTLEFAMNDWYLPPATGTIICAGEQSPGVHTLGSTMRSYFNYIPRWTLYRGT